MKKLLCTTGLIIILILINYLVINTYLNGLKNLKELDSKETLIVDNENDKAINVDEKLYNKLAIKNLYVLVDDNKISWSYKKSNKTYYLYLPNSVDRNNVKINFNIGVNTYLSIYDANNNLIKKILNDDGVDLSKEDYIFKLETNVKKITSYKVKVLQSKLPAIMINLKGGNKAFNKIKNDKNHNVNYPGYATISSVDEQFTERVIRFKGRGNSTWKRSKKPFSLKFEDKVSIFGMKEAKDFNLLANYFDGTLSRNSIWLSLAQDMGMEFSAEFKPVELYVNNNYQGSYLLTSTMEVDENRVNIDELEYFFESDDHKYNVQFRLKKGYPIKVHNPDLANYSKKDRKKILKDAKKYLTKIDNLITNKNTPLDELEKYVDVYSFAKYYWINELSLNFDVSRRSFYMYQKDGKLYAGPIWDMDTTMNNSFNYASNKGYYILDNSRLNNQRIDENWFKYLVRRDDFSQLLDKVYFEYRNVFDKLPQKLEEYNSLISESARMNYVRWPYEAMKREQRGDSWRKNDNSYNSSYKLFHNDLVSRVNWYSKQYENLYYKNLRYEVYDNSNNIIVNENVKQNISMSIPNSAKLVKIYGTNDLGKEVLLKEVEVLDKYIDASFTLRNKTSSKYKKYNNYNYKISFIVI